MKENKDFKTTVLADLRKHQEKVDLIISLIDEDSQLASIIDSPSASLTTLRKMIPIERSLHVMRGLRNNCTELLEYLIKKHVKDLASIKIPLDIYNSPPAAHKFLDQYYKDDKYLPLLVELIKTPLGPFNAEKTMSAVLPLLLSPFALFAINKVMNICAFIVKSHPNLSEFFKTNLDTSQKSEELLTIPMTEFILLEVMPRMDSLDLDVTMDDWVQCGFIPPQ